MRFSLLTGNTAQTSNRILGDAGLKYSIIIYDFQKSLYARVLGLPK